MAWNALGVELSRNSECDEAERCLLKALYTEPKNESENHHNVVTYHSLAVTMKKMGRPVESKTYCAEGLRIAPRNQRLLELQRQLG